MYVHVDLNIYILFCISTVTYDVRININREFQYRKILQIKNIEIYLRKQEITK